jgi:hypothetical protein
VSIAVDLRTGRLDLLLAYNRTSTITLGPFPADYLTGRTFEAIITSTVADKILTVTVDSLTLDIAIENSDTTGLPETSKFLMVETTSGTDEPFAAGWVKLSNDPGHPTTQSFTVRVSATVTVPLVVSQSSTASGLIARGQPWFDVKAYGAVGNSTDDTVAIQAAIDAAELAGRGTVRFPPGVYIVSSGFTVTGDNLTFEGDGQFSTRIIFTHTTGWLFTGTNRNFLKFKGMQIESNVAKTNGGIFNFTNCDKLRFQDLRINSVWKAGDLVDCDDIELESVTLLSGVGTWKRGWFFQSCTQIVLERFYANLGVMTLPTADDAILILDSGIDTFIGSNVLIACQAGAGGQVKPIITSHSLSPGSFAPRWIRFTNLVLEAGSTTEGIDARDFNSFYITNGYVVTCRQGAIFAAGTDLKLTNVLFANNKRDGCRVGSSSGIVSAAITDCTFSDNGQETTNTYDGLIIGGGTVARITDCYFGDRVLGQTPKQRYGINNASLSCAVINPTFENLGTANALETNLFSMYLDPAARVMRMVDVEWNREGADIIRTPDKCHIVGEVEVDGALNHDGSTVGFYGAAPAVKPTVTGSRGSNAALASLLTSLAALGLITDSTS